jgi:hypothetical protein
MDAPDPLQQRFVRAFAELTEWEQAQLVSSLERIADKLGAQDMDASPVLTTGNIRTGKKADGGTPERRVHTFGSPLVNRCTEGITSSSFHQSQAQVSPFENSP